MATPLEWIVGLVLLAGLAAFIVHVGYLAYQARMARAHLAELRRNPAPDFVAELARLHAQAAATMADAQRTMERARVTLHKGLRG